MALVSTNKSTLFVSIEVKNTAMRTVVGVSCSLSILGSLLIIFSYILFKKRRTKAREILLHISFMDLGVALSNLIGLSVYFDRFYRQYGGNMTEHEYIDYLCKAQGFFSAYTTYASILWTIALAGFMYFLIIHHNNANMSLYFRRASYIICYGLPFFVSLWFVLTGKLGYSPLDSAGWCSLISKDSVTGRVDIFTTIFGSDLWVYLAMVTIPVLYFSIRCHLVNQVKDVSHYVTPEKFWSSLNHVDYKFLLIPVVFVFLRMWTAIANFLFFYLQIPADSNHFPPKLISALMYLSGIGDSSQGFANAVLFVIFTKNIRESFIRYFCCRKKRTNVIDDDNAIEKQADSDPSNLNTISSDRNRAVAEKSEASGLFGSVAVNRCTESGIIQSYGGIS